MLRLRHSGAPMDVSISRRGFVAGGCAFASMFAVGGAAYALSGDDPEPLRPPGAQDAAHFAATCLKCNRCESACPQQCLRTGVLEDGILNWRTPIMDFHRGACTFCGACEDVCPAGSIAARATNRRSSAWRKSTKTGALRSRKADAACAWTHAPMGPSLWTRRCGPWWTQAHAMGAAPASSRARRTHTCRLRAESSAASTSKSHEGRHK